jgi:hypothetical protein
MRRDDGTSADTSGEQSESSLDMVLRLPHDTFSDALDKFHSDGVYLGLSPDAKAVIDEASNIC